MMMMMIGVCLLLAVAMIEVDESRGGLGSAAEG